MNVPALLFDEQQINLIECEGLKKCFRDCKMYNIRY